MDELPKLPEPEGYWADGSEGWGQEAMRAYGQRVAEASNQAWRATVMTIIDEFVSPELRTAAREKVGLTYGMRLRAMMRERGKAAGT